MVKKTTEALVYFLNKIYIRFGSMLYRQYVGIPMGTNYAPIVADLFLFYYERDFFVSYKLIKGYDMIHALKSSSRYSTVSMPFISLVFMFKQKKSMSLAYSTQVPRKIYAISTLLA